MGTVKVPFLYKKHTFLRFFDIKSNEYIPIEEIIKNIKEGDILLSTSKGHLSNFFNKMVNKGKYNHALLYVGNILNQPSIVEGVGEGVVIKPLNIFLLDKDFFCIIRPYDSVANEQQKKEAIRFALAQIGKDYDYLFEMGGKKGGESYFCSELVYEAYKHANTDIKFVRREVMGYETVAPNDFYNAKKYFRVIYEYSGN